jgi:hypothetical protein
MAQKQKTRKSRIVSVSAWAFILLIGSIEIARTPGNPPFLALLQIAVALIVIFSEIKGLIEEPRSS